MSCTGPPETHPIARATGHPTKFATAVEKALKVEKDLQLQALLPGQFVGFRKAAEEIVNIEKDWWNRRIGEVD